MGVTAECVYEAAALGLSRLRRDEWADQIAPESPTPAFVSQLENGLVPPPCEPMLRFQRAGDSGTFR